MVAPKKHPSKYGSIALLVAAAILLFLAQSAYWVNHTIFNQANFSNITTTALLSESSRDAIADSVVNKSLENRPVVKQVVGDRASALISGLLDSDLSNQAVKGLTNKTYSYVTSSDRQDIKIDLISIKTPIESVITITQRENGPVASTLNQVPDEIVLVRSDAFPDLSGTVKLMLWLGPFLWLGALASFAAYIYIGRAIYARRVYVAGGTIIAVALFGLAATPFIPPPVAAAVPNIDLRVVAENLANGFLAPFRTQMLNMLGITSIVLLAFSLRFKVTGLIDSLNKKRK